MEIKEKQKKKVAKSKNDMLKKETRSYLVNR